MLPHPHLKPQPTIESVAKTSNLACRQFLSQWRSVLESSFLITTSCNNQVRLELGELQMPTLLMIGQKDTTAIGKDAAPPEVRATLGRYPELGRLAARTIPRATLVEFADMGHAPQMQDPQAFNKALLDGLAAGPGNP